MNSGQNSRETKRFLEAGTNQIVGHPTQVAQTKDEHMLELTHISGKSAALGNYFPESIDRIPKVRWGLCLSRGCPN